MSDLVTLRYLAWLSTDYIQSQRCLVSTSQKTTASKRKAAEISVETEASEAPVVTSGSSGSIVPFLSAGPSSSTAPPLAASDVLVAPVAPSTVKVFDHTSFTPDKEGKANFTDWLARLPKRFKTACGKPLLGGDVGKEYVLIGKEEKAVIYIFIFILWINSQRLSPRAKARVGKLWNESERTSVRATDRQISCIRTACACPLLTVRYMCDRPRLSEASLASPSRLCESESALRPLVVAGLIPQIV